MAIFEENGEYTEHYLKHFNRFLLNKFKKYSKNKEKKEYFKYKTYSEFLDTDKIFSNLKYITEDKMNRGRPKKTPTISNTIPNKIEQPPIQEIREVVNTTPNIIDKQETVIVDNKKKYSLRPVDNFKNFKELNNAFYMLLYGLHISGYIKINEEEFKKINDNRDNVHKTNLLLYTLLFDKVSNKSVFRFTDDEYSKLPQYLKDTLHYNN